MTPPHPVGDTVGSVSGLLLRPEDAWAAYVLAHGAGAGMRHRFMESIAAALAERGDRHAALSIPLLRDAGTGRPDPPGVLEATRPRGGAGGPGVLPGLPLVAGGKSLGGRMTSNADGPAAAGRAAGSGLPRLPAPSRQAAGHRRAPSTSTGWRRRCSSSRAPGTTSPISASSPRSAPGSAPRATLHVVEGGRSFLRGAQALRAGPMPKCWTELAGTTAGLVPIDRDCGRARFGVSTREISMATDHEIAFPTLSPKDIQALTARGRPREVAYRRGPLCGRRSRLLLLRDARRRDRDPRALPRHAPHRRSAQETPVHRRRGHADGTPRPGHRAGRHHRPGAPAQHRRASPRGGRAAGAGRDGDQGVSHCAGAC